MAVGRFRSAYNMFTCRKQNVTAAMQYIGAITKLSDVTKRIKHRLSRCFSLGRHIMFRVQADNNLSGLGSRKLLKLIGTQNTHITTSETSSIKQRLQHCGEHHRIGPIRNPVPYHIQYVIHDCTHTMPSMMNMHMPKQNRSLTCMGK